MVVVVGANFGADRKAGGYGQANGSHFSQIGALAS